MQPTRPGHAAHEPAHRALGEPVDVLLRRDQVDDRVGVEAARERQLDEDAVDVGIGGQLGDRGLDLALRRRRRQVDVARPHPDLGRLALLAAHVALARRVVADEHRRQADRRRAGRLDALRAGPSSSSSRSALPSITIAVTGPHCYARDGVVARATPYARRPVTTPPPSPTVQPADGRLGVLTVGLGAVASTLIAGVELVKRGLAEPIGSLALMDTIRLGKRTDDRNPLIKDFAPIAALDDVVFGAWDPFPDDAYVAAQRAGVLDAGKHVEQISDALRDVRPMPAAFDRTYVKNIDADNTKGRIGKRAMLEAIREDINRFREEKQVDRVVMIWCASTEIFIEPGPAHVDLEAFEAAIDADDPTIAPSMLYAYAALLEGVPFCNGAPNLTVDMPGAARPRHRARPGHLGQGLQDRPDADQDGARRRCSRPACSGCSGWYSTNILGNRDGEVLDDPDSFKTKEESKLGVLEHILQPDTLPRAVRRHLPQGADQLLPPARRQQGGVGQHRHLRVARLPDADQGRLPLPRLDPRRPAGPRPRAVHRPRPAGRARRHPGVAELLLQEPDGRARAARRGRPVHPADQAQEHAALDHGRGPDHPPRPRVLRGGVRRPAGPVLTQSHGQMWP